MTSNLRIRVSQPEKLRLEALDIMTRNCALRTNLARSRYPILQLPAGGV